MNTFSLEVRNLGLEGHAAIKCVIDDLQKYGVMHQGLGPGVARVLTTGMADSPMLLCELNTATGSRPEGHIASLACSGAVEDATGLSEVLEGWRQQHPGLPLAIGQEALAAHLKDPKTLTPQGIYVAAGTKCKGMLLEIQSPQMDRERRVPLRSIAKALVSVAILALQDAGLVDINQPLASILPEWGTCPAKAAITVLQVMCHTSGICDSMSELLSVVDDPHISLAESSRRLAAQPLRYTSGEFHYNNPAYNILGAIAEKVTGNSWHQVFKDTVAGPLGMKNTYFVNIFSDEVTPSNPSLGMGGVSTATDMMKFVSMVLNQGALPATSSVQEPNGSNSSNKRVLSEASFKLFVTGQARKTPSTKDYVWDFLVAPEDGSVPQKVQQQIDAGFMPQAAAIWGLQQWSHTEYALGSWCNTHGTTGKRSISWLSAYNSYLSIDDTDGDDPIWLIFMAYSHTPQAPGCRPGTILQEALEQCLSTEK